MYVPVCVCVCVYVPLVQVFDVLPLSGVLPPGQTQQVQLTFYGHSGLAVHVVAVCQVEGGPTYHVHLRGEAAQVSYHLDRTTVDCGKQVGGGRVVCTFIRSYVRMMHGVVWSFMHVHTYVCVCVHVCTYVRT